jgi:hypothetical protein
MSSLVSNASNVPTATQSAFNRGPFMQPPPSPRDALRREGSLSQSDASVVALFLTNAAFNLGQFDLLPGYVVDLEENSVKR